MRSQPQAEAIAIAGERILAVGSNDEVAALAGRATKIVDLGRQDGHARFHRRALPPRRLRAAAPAVHRLRPALDHGHPGTPCASAPRRPRRASGWSASSTTTRRPRSGASSRARTSTPRRPITPSTSSTAAGTPGYVNSLALAKAGITETDAGPRRAASSCATRRRADSPDACSSAPRRSFEESIPAFDTTTRDDGPRGRQAHHADVREGGRHLFDRRLRHAGRPARLPGRARGRRALRAHLLHDRLLAPRRDDRRRRAHRPRRRLGARRRHEARPATARSPSARRGSRSPTSAGRTTSA